MAIRTDITLLQIKGVPNTVLGWGPDGEPLDISIFVPPTAIQEGAIGLVPKPLAGQQDYILSAHGWIVAPTGGGGGGSGNVIGTGVANRLSFWTAVDTIGHDDTLTYDATNNILKARTINLSISGLPPGGISDGDLVYDTADKDFRGRVDAKWTRLTKQREVVKPSNITTYDVVEDDRNTRIVFTANTPVTVNLNANVLSVDFAITIAKEGTGDITVSTGAGPALIASSNVIQVKPSAAYFQHSGGGLWRGYGSLGTIGAGSVTEVTLAGITNFIGVTNPTINTSGTIQLTLNQQPAKTFFRGPAAGLAAAIPTFGVITQDDLPRLLFDQQPGTSYILREIEDFGRIVDLTSLGNVTCVIPTTLPQGWYCSVYRSGGQVTFSSSYLQAEAAILGTQFTMAAVIVFPSNGGANLRHVVVGKLG